MLKNSTCQSQCKTNVTIDAVNAKFINERILEQYNVRWYFIIITLLFLILFYFFSFLQIYI